jgi:hypothetical protein
MKPNIIIITNGINLHIVAIVCIVPPNLDPTVFNVSANLKVKDAIKTLGDILYGE